MSNIDLVFVGLCHKCFCSNLNTELVDGLPLCLKCKIVNELNSMTNTSMFRMELDSETDSD